LLVRTPNEAIVDALESYGSIDVYLLTGLAILFAAILYWAFHLKNRCRLERHSQRLFHDPFDSEKG
jgi:cbb3-type cytochrome oxidase subunit 3